MVQIIKENRQPSTSQRFAQAFGAIGQGTAQMIPEMLKGQEAKKKEEQNKGARKKFADELLTLYPNSPTHQMYGKMLNSDMTDDQIDKMSKPLFGTNPYRDMQQRRLERESQVNYWKSKINDMRKRWEKSYRRADKLELEKQIQEYQKEMDKVFMEAKNLDPEHYFDMKKSQSTDEFDGQSDSPIEINTKENIKISFDMNNSKHQNKARQLYNGFTGTDAERKEKTKKALRREFSNVF